MSTQDIRIGTLILQPGRQLLADGARVQLTRKPLEILSVLANARGELVTKDELINAVWPHQVVEEGAMHVHIAALRKALGAEAGRLKTVHGFGYRLEVPADSGADSRSPLARPPHRSIAVLPFANLTGDPSMDYLAEGIAEELITALSRAGGLRVSSRTSSFAYRDRVTDLREIGRQLGVAAIVEGSVRVGGGRIRLTIQLIDSASDFHIWSDNFDRSFGDLLELQDELARSVAAALGRELGHGVPPTISAEAMQLCLQGRSMARRLTDDALVRAETLLRRAIALDPDFAGAREGLAAVLLLAIYSGVMPHQARDETRLEAERAIALDPALPIARTIVACLDALRGAWGEAERNFTAQLALNDVDPAVHEALASFVLLPAGLLRRARAHAERALELAPARAQASLVCSLCEMMLGDHGASARYLDMSVMLGISERSPHYRILRGNELLFQGRFDEAGALIAGGLPEVAREAGGEKVVRDLYRLFSGNGDPIAAGTRASAFFDSCRGSDAFWSHASVPSLLFGWQTVLGRIDEAYRIVDAIVERMRRTGHLPTAILDGLWMPHMAAFRADPRFQTLVRDFGMLDLWASTGPPDGYALSDGRLTPA